MVVLLKCSQRLMYSLICGWDLLSLICADALFAVGLSFAAV